MSHGGYTIFILGCSAAISPWGRYGGITSEALMALLRGRDIGCWSRPCIPPRESKNGPISFAAGFMKIGLGLGPTASAATLLAHSLGGLDGRYLLARLDGAEYIDTFITGQHATPRKPVCGLLDAACGPADADCTCRRNGDWTCRLLPISPVALRGSTSRSATCRGCDIIRFRRRWRWQTPVWARHAWNVVAQAEANDSLVSVKSAVWVAHWYVGGRSLACHQPPLHGPGPQSTGGYCSELPGGFGGGGKTGVRRSAADADISMRHAGQRAGQIKTS